MKLLVHMPNHKAHTLYLQILCLFPSPCPGFCTCSMHGESLWMKLGNHSVLKYTQKDALFFTQASDMGHSRTGTIQDHHPELLPWCKWGDSGLWYFQCRYLQPRTTVAGWCQKICRLVIACVMISQPFLGSLLCGNVAIVDWENFAAQKFNMRKKKNYVAMINE